MSSGDFNQLKKNLRMNIASFGCNIIVGLWLVPYLVRHLGIAAYGLVPLAMVFTEYVSIITQSFNTAVSRFLTVELRGVQTDGSVAVFNSSLALMTALSLLQILAATVVLTYFDKLIAVPIGLMHDTLWLFALTFAGFIFSMLGGVFNVAMYSKNRLDLMRINDIVRLSVRTVVTVLLFSLFEPNLLYVGVGNFLAGACALLLSIIQWRQLAPELVINLRKIEFARIKPIAGMAGWVIVNTVGYLLFLRIDIYIVNRFIGPEAGGEYAAVLHWSQLVRTAAGVFSGVITPLGMIYYAQGEMQKLAQMIGMAVKLMSLALALPLALLCVFSSDILGFWLGDSFRSLGGLMTLQLCTLVVNLGVLPLFSINMATNRIKIPAILTLVMGGLNFFLAILFVQKFDLGYYGVAFAGIIVLTIKNVIFTPWYAAHLLDLKNSTFFRPLLNGFLAFCLLYVGAFVVRNLVQSQSLTGVGLTLLSLLLAFVLPLAWWGLSKKERTLVSDFAPKKFRGWFRKLLLVPQD